MSYYDALIAKWSTLTGTTAEKLGIINSLTAPGPIVDVPVSSVVGYLAFNGKLAGLLDYAAAPPSGAVPMAVIAAKELSAYISSPNAPHFGMSNPANYAVVSSFLDALVSDPNTGLTATDKTNILALASSVLPWWKANGYTSPISDADLFAAGGLS